MRVIVFQYVLFCVAATAVCAQSSSQRFHPTPVKGYSGSMSYLYLQDSVDVWLPDLFDLNSQQVLERISDNGKTTVPLSHHRLRYVDGIVNDQNGSRIEVLYTSTSNRIYVTKDDLYALGIKFRALRDDFFKSVEVPGLIRMYQSVGAVNGDKVLIKQDGSVETVENTGSGLYDEHDLLLNYYSSEWTKILQDGTYTDLDDGKQKVIGMIDEAEVIIVRNNDGTFSSITSQLQVPGGWTMKTVRHYDAWTTDSAILLPGKRDWKTMLVDKESEVTLVSSHIRLLNLGDKDFIKPR